VLVQVQRLQHALNVIFDLCGHVVGRITYFKNSW